MAIKHENKLKLCKWIKGHCNVDLNPDSLFDVQVKRIHEYKRQLMNILYVVHRYLKVRRSLPDEKRQL